MASREFRASYVLWLMIGMAAAVVAWAVIRPWPERKPEPDMVKVISLNNEGVGWMEQFEYEKAYEVFQKITIIAPDWLPAKINMGIARLNSLGEKAKKGAEQNFGPWDEALQIFGDVLKNDPNNLHAHYCTGIIYYNQGRFEEARPHLRFVADKDPDDPHTWYFLAEVHVPQWEKCYEFAMKAIKLNPFLTSPYSRAKTYLDIHDPAKAKTFDQWTENLKKAKQEEHADLVFTHMGKYADVIGKYSASATVPIGPIPQFTPSKKFHVQLAPGTRWATAADFGTGVVADLRRAVRQRFGGVIVVLDYDQDGKQDLFLVGAVVEDGEVRDLLLHNEGGGKFRDATKEMGLARDWPSLGCCVGDFNNDGYPDLLITGAGHHKLFTNVPAGKGKRQFKDETTTAGLDKVKTVCLSAMWIDLDQDSDLDLLLCQYADTPKAALAALKGQAEKPDLPGTAGLGLAVFLNVGKATTDPKEETPIHIPLTTAFKRLDKNDGLLGKGGNAVQLAATDLDRDHDLDIISLADGKSPSLILNDRLMAFHPAKLPAELAGPARWNGALIFDSQHHERSDLFMLRQGEKPLFLINQPGGNEKKAASWFKPGITNSPPLISAQAIDLDLDGWTDILGLSATREPVLLHNDGHRLVHVPDVFGLKSTLPKDLIGVVALDVFGHCVPDVLLWSEKDGLQLQESVPNGNHGLILKITGFNWDKKSLRTNADGFGAWVVAQAGTVWTGGEVTTLSAGLGQSQQPLLLGLGKYASADVVRLHWPDQLRQAELDIPGCHLHTLHQNNRMGSSCPLLFTWNGEKFVFITDILGAGEMGEAGPDGGFRPPRPEESIKIEAHQLAAKNGKFQIKITEVRDEIAYLDHFQLMVIDHPPELLVYPDERFAGTGPAPSQDLLVFKKDERIFPVHALNHKGTDVTAKLLNWDRNAVDAFALRSWVGFAEDHWIELDFGKLLAQFSPEDKLLLCLAGWTDYPYPESIWAAHQAGVELQPPELQRLGKNGQWETVLADMGFPAGLPRMITVDVTGKLTGPACKLRIRTNMQVFWDQIFVVPLLERMLAAKQNSTQYIKVHPLPVAEATLSYRGFLQEFSPDGKKPTLYNYDRLEPAAVPKFTGNLTKLGNVTELLKQRDDLFVIMGPGDELTMLFDAEKLPDQPKGWKRSFVLQSCGWTRSAGLFTAEAGTVAPLPFHGMKNFPYGAKQSYPQTPKHLEYLKTYNTRKASGAGS